MRGWENVTVLPDRIARMLTPAERAKMGKGAMTAEEAIAKADARTERELQEQIRTLLEAHRGIVVIWSRMDRKATTPPGTPDFIFAVGPPDVIKNASWPGFRLGQEVFACAWEIKNAHDKLDPEQVKMRDRMTTAPNAWRYRLISSLEAARQELAQMGL